MESFDSLLTCCICLDRFRNPKLLPCQHTFCMEPCMEGLIDYVKRQLKCPECRAEHRIPYKGIQEFPSNVTMQRFLQMYQSISGELPDPNQGQVMERCPICNEKEYLQPCAHCEKKICADCKSAHVDVLKREVVRINSQVRRGVHKLYDVATRLEQAVVAVKSSGQAVTAEVESLAERLVKAIRERTEQLKAEVDSHMATEVDGLNTLRDNLKLEIANIESNSELAERHMAVDPTADWDDCELMDAKEIFLKTVEFIRNFEQEAPNAADIRRPIRFSAAQDPLLLHKTLEQLGELHITKSMITDGGMTNGPSNGFALAHCSSSSALARSKSDHRLAQLRQEADEYGGGSSTRRRFGERVSSRRGSNDSGDHDTPLSSVERRQRYRSRMMRRTFDTDDEQDGLRQEPPPPASTEKKRESVLDTDDASRGPLSGITRIADVPRVMQKLADAERGPRRKPEPVPVAAPAPAAPTPTPWRRQHSEEDEVAKIKRQNKEADARCSRGGATAAAEESPPSPRAASSSRGSADRHATQPAAPTSTLQRPYRVSRDESASETEDSSRRRPSRVSRPSAAAAISETAHEAPEARRSTLATPQRKISEPARLHTRTAPSQVSRSSSGSSLNTVSLETPRLAPLRHNWERRVSRSNSSDSNSSESSAAPKHTGAAFSTSELKSRFMRGGVPPTPPETARGSASGAGSTYSTSRALSGPSSRPPTQPAAASSQSQTHNPSSTSHSRPRFQSRFLGRAGTPKAEGSKEFTSSSACSESESESSSDSDSDVGRAGPYRGRVDQDMASTSIGPLLARSAHARAVSSSGAGAETTSAVSSPVSPGLPSGRRLSRPNSLTSSYSRDRGDSAAAEFTPSTATSTVASTDRYGSRRQGLTDLSPTSPQPKPRYGSSVTRYGSGDYSPGAGLVRSRTSSHLDSRSASFDAHDSYSPYTSKYTSRSSRPSYDDYSAPPRYSAYSSSRYLNTAESCAATNARDTSPPASAGAADGRRERRVRSTSSRQTPGGSGNGGGRDVDAEPLQPPVRRRRTLVDEHSPATNEQCANEAKLRRTPDKTGKTTVESLKDVDSPGGIFGPCELQNDDACQQQKARHTLDGPTPVIQTQTAAGSASKETDKEHEDRCQRMRRQARVSESTPRSADTSRFSAVSWRCFAYLVRLLYATVLMLVASTSVVAVCMCVTWIPSLPVSSFLQPQAVTS